MTRATTESRARGQRKVLVVSAGTGVAALAVTGLLTVGLGTGTTTATGTSTTTGTSRTSSDDTTSGVTSSVTSTGQPAVATSGGS